MTCRKPEMPRGSWPEAGLLRRPLAVVYSPQGGRKAAPREHPLAPPFVSPPALMIDLPLLPLIAVSVAATTARMRTQFRGSGIWAESSRHDAIDSPRLQMARRDVARRAGSTRCGGAKWGRGGEPPTGQTRKTP